MYETAEIGCIEETLKWGELSYISKTGSAIRLGWHLNRLPTRTQTLYSAFAYLSQSKASAVARGLKATR